MDSRLHGNDGRRAPRKEGVRKEKERGHSCPLPLVVPPPPEKMEISKRERERRERYPNAAAANAAATTGGQECPPSVRTASSIPIAIEGGARCWWWRARGGRHSRFFCHSCSFCHSRESGNPSSHGTAGVWHTNRRMDFLMDSRLHGNDGRRAPTEGDPPLSPPGRGEI